MNLKFDERGLLTTVVQDAATSEVLMVAWMNAEALRLTRETGEAWFWSRSRGELWRKGATSGNLMRVREILVDCDADTLLLKVAPAGPACHTGETSCFYRKVELGRSCPRSPLGGAVLRVFRPNSGLCVLVNTPLEDFLDRN